MIGKFRDAALAPFPNEKKTEDMHPPNAQL